MRQGADPDGAASAPCRGPTMPRPSGLIAENASDVVYRADPDGVITWISPSAEALFGCAPADIVGRSISDFVHPDDRDATLEFWRSVIATAASGRVESRIVRRDGVAVWVAGSARPARTDDGSVVGFVGDLRDIDAEREARDALAARTAELEEARRITRLGVWRRDLRTGTTTWSREMFEIFGFDPAGPPPAPEAIDALLPPESRAARDRAVAASDADGTWGTELEIRRADGAAGRVRQNGAVARDAAGTVIAYHGTARDITERRRAELAVEASEARLRATLEAAPESLRDLRAGPRRRRQVRRRRDRLHERHRPRPVVRRRSARGGRAGRASSSASRSSARTSSTSTAMSSTRACRSRRCRRLESPAGEIWMDLRVAPVPGGFVHTSRDITAARLAQQAVERAHAELAEAQRIAHVGSWRLGERLRALPHVVGRALPDLRPRARRPRPRPPAAEESLFDPESVRPPQCGGGGGDRQRHLPPDLEIEFIRADGEHRPAGSPAASQCATPPAPFVELRGTFHDVTEAAAGGGGDRALSEAHLRSITETAREAIVTASDDGTIVDWNAGRRRSSSGGPRRRRSGGRCRSSSPPRSTTRTSVCEASVPRERRSARGRADPGARGARSSAGRLALPDRAVARRVVRDGGGHFATAIILSHHFEAKGGGRRLRQVRGRARRGAADRARRQLGRGTPGRSDVVGWSDELFRIFGLEPGLGGSVVSPSQQRFYTPDSRERLTADVARASLCGPAAPTRRGSTSSGRTGASGMPSAAAR